MRYCDIFVKGANNMAGPAQIGRNSYRLTHSFQMISHSICSRYDTLPRIWTECLIIQIKILWTPAHNVTHNKSSSPDYMTSSFCSGKQKISIAILSMIFFYWLELLQSVFANSFLLFLLKPDMFSLVPIIYIRRLH